MSVSRATTHNCEATAALSEFISAAGVRTHSPIKIKSTSLTHVSITTATFRHSMSSDCIEMSSRSGVERLSVRIEETTSWSSGNSVLMVGGDTTIVDVSERRARPNKRATAPSALDGRRWVSVSSSSGVEVGRNLLEMMERRRLRESTVEPMSFGDRPLSVSPVDCV